MLAWLLSLSLSASTVSHAPAPVPAGLPGPASPEAPAGKRKKLNTLLFQANGASETHDCLDCSLASLSLMPTPPLLD